MTGPDRLQPYRESQYMYRATEVDWLSIRSCPVMDPGCGEQVLVEFLGLGKISHRHRVRHRTAYRFWAWNFCFHHASCIAWLSPLILSRASASAPRADPVALFLM